MVASTSATAATDFGRALSPSERWFWIIDQISPANCIGRVRVHGHITADQWERAAAAVVAEYPLLRMGVVDLGGGHPRLEPLDDPRIPLRQWTVDDPEDWQREIEAELVAPIDVGVGLARLTDLVHAPGTPAEHHDLILTISHIIVDGRSLMAVLRKLVEYAAFGGDDPYLEATQRDDNHQGRSGSRPPIAPADDLIPAAARGFWRYSYTTLFDQAAALLLRPRRLGGATPVPLPQRRTRAVQRTVTAEPLAGLIADCRSAGVTVHGALAAAVAQAIGDAVRPGATSMTGPEWRGRSLGSKGIAGIGSPVDFRPLLDPQPDVDELGVYAPVLAGFVPFGPEVSWWEAARSVKRQLERGVRQQRHLATVAGMRYATPRTIESGVRLVEMVDRRAPWNVSVTNLGRIEFPEQIGSWRLSSVTLAASNSCVSALTVAIVTAHDEMSIGFCYVDGILTESQAEAFADRVLAELVSRPDPEAAVN